MTLYVDAPIWPAHGRRWAHLISDTSRAELHAFAEHAGIPARGFDGDHYDVPAESIPDLLRAGAKPCTTRELVAILARGSLRSQRPRSAKPRYASRDLAVGAALVGPGADAMGGAAGRFADGLGYAVLLTAADLPGALEKMHAHSPAVDAAVVVHADAAQPLAALRGVSEDYALTAGGGIPGGRPFHGAGEVPDLDGRISHRHSGGAAIIGRTHFLDLGGEHANG